MENKKRSAAFIKIKHSILSCENMMQLKSVMNMIQAHPDQDEFMILLSYYNTKEMEIDPYYYEEELLNIQHKRLSA